ncbi:MAG: histidine phosphatase family protein [Pseudomonadota bacterium]
MPLTYRSTRADLIVAPLTQLKRRILFVRHGETDWNAERRMQGQRNVPLNQKGESQARTVGEILAGLLSAGNEVDVWCSPLMRCQRTYELASETYRAAFGAPLPAPSFDDRLKEITFGPMEGKTLAELPPEQAEARAKDHWAFRVEGAESYADGAVRAADWLSEQTSSAAPLLVFSHSGICRGLRHVLLNIPGEEASNSAIPQGVVIEWSKWSNKGGSWSEERFTGT